MGERVRSESGAMGNVYVPAGGAGGRVGRHLLSASVWFPSRLPAAAAAAAPAVAAPPPPRPNYVTRFHIPAPRPPPGLAPPVYHSVRSARKKGERERRGPLPGLVALFDPS
jgi:hypothetical protein